MRLVSWILLGKNSKLNLANWFGCHKVNSTSDVLFPKKGPQRSAGSLGAFRKTHWRDHVQVFTFQTKLGPNFFINIYNQHSTENGHDHIYGRRNLHESEVNSEGFGNPDYICKSAWRENKVSLYIVESHRNPAQHSTDQQHTVGQTRFAENATHRIKDYYNSARKKEIAVSALVTGFTVGFYHTYSEAGRWSMNEILTVIDVNKMESFNFFPKLSTLKNHFLNLRL